MSRGRAFSGLNGSISTDFLDGINDHGANAGESAEFTYGNRYGYPDHEHDHSHFNYHSISPIHYTVSYPIHYTVSYPRNYILSR